MNANEYHKALTALDRVLDVFHEPGVELSDGDRHLLYALELIRSEILKAESGHPFPSKSLFPTRRRPDPDAESPAGTTIRPQETGESGERITIVVVDDQPSVRAVVRALLEAETGFEVVAEATNGLEAIELSSKCRPNVVMMDLEMPVLDGITATRELLRRSPETKVIVYSADHDPATVQKAADAGAVGYLFKPAKRQLLARAVREAHQGWSVFYDREEQFSNVTGRR